MKRSLGRADGFSETTEESSAGRGWGVGTPGRTAGRRTARRVRLRLENRVRRWWWGKGRRSEGSH